MSQPEGHGPPANTTQFVGMESNNGIMHRLPICPRCAHRSHLIFGLLKTPPVCIDCALDSTWTNPQENWPTDKLNLPQETVFQGKVGPHRIIVQRPKYSVLEVCGTHELLLVDHNSRRTFKLLRRIEHTFGNHVANDNFPNVSTTNNQNLGQLNPMKGEIIQQSHTMLALANETRVTSEKMISCPLLKSLLNSTPQEFSKLSVNADNICLTKQLEQSNGNIVQRRISKVNNPHYVGIAMTNSPMQNDQLYLNYGTSAYDRSRKHNQETQEILRNVKKTNLNKCGGMGEVTKLPQRMTGNTYIDLKQKAVDLSVVQNMRKLYTANTCYAMENPWQQNCSQLFGDYCGHTYENWTLNQDISQIQREAMLINTQHAKITKVGNLVVHDCPSVVIRDDNCPYEVAVPENVYPPEFQNNMFFGEADEGNTLPELQALTEHTTPLNANNWSYKVTADNSIPNDNEMTSMFQNQLSCHKTLTNSVMPEQQGLSKATNDMKGMQTQEKQNVGMLGNHNMDNWHSTHHYSDFVNPKQLPPQVTFIEQAQSPSEVIDLTYKTATTENQCQLEAAKPINQKVNILYPYSIFNSNFDNPNTLVTTTKQGKSTDVKTMASKMATVERCAQMQPLKADNKETLSTHDHNTVFNLIEEVFEKAFKPIVTPVPDHKKTPQNPINLNPKTAPEEKHPQIQETDKSANMGKKTFATEEVNEEELLIKSCHNERGTTHNGSQIQREMSGNKEASSIFCNKLDKLDKLVFPFATEEVTEKSFKITTQENCMRKSTIKEVGKQKATNSDPKTASKEKNLQIQEARNPITKTSDAKLREFETIEDLLCAIKTRTFAAHNVVLSTKPVLINMTVNNTKKDTKNENTKTGPSLVRHHPRIPLPNKTIVTVEAASPQKMTTVAVDKIKDQETLAQKKRMNLKQVINKSEEILVQCKNTDKLENLIEREKHNLRVQKAMREQLEQILARLKSNMECAKEVVDNKNREKQTIINVASDSNVKKKDGFLEDIYKAPQIKDNCQKKESNVLNTSHSNVYKDTEIQTEKKMQKEAKRRLSAELKRCSKRLRDEAMDLVLPQIEEVMQNLEQKQQLDTKHDWKGDPRQTEKSRREQPTKKIAKAFTEENSIQKDEVLRNTHMETLKVVSEKDIKCGVKECEMSTNSNPENQNNTDQRLPKQDTDPTITSNVRMADFAYCHKKEEKINNDSRVASKTWMTPKHESNQASKPVYAHGKQPREEGLDISKEIELLKNGKTIRRSVSLPVKQGFDKLMGRKRHYSEVHSSKGSINDLTSLKNSLKHQEVETAVKRPKYADQESKRGSKTQKKVPHLEAQQDVKRVKGIMSTKYSDLPKFAKQRNVEKPEEVVHTVIKQSESHSKVKKEDEQLSHTTSDCVAIRENKTKRPRDQNLKNGNTKSFETMLPKTAKHPYTSKKLKFHKTLLEEEANFTETSFIETHNTSSIKKCQTSKQPLTQNEKRVQRKQESRSENSNDSSHSKTAKTVLSTQNKTQNPKRSTKSKCGLQTDAAHKKKMCLSPTKDFIQNEECKAHKLETSDQNKLSQHHSKKMEYTNPNDIGMCLSVDNLINEENHQSKKPCINTSQVTLNEPKKELPKLQNKGTKINNSSDNDQMHHAEKTQDSGKRHPQRKSRVDSTENQGGNIDNHKLHRKSSSTITPKPCKYQFNKVEGTYSDYIAMCLSVDKLIKEENNQSKKSCTSVSQVTLNEIKTEMPELQNPERKKENICDNDHRQMHKTTPNVEKPKDTRSRHRERKSNRDSTHDKNHKAHSKESSTITQKPCKQESKEEETQKTSSDNDVGSKSRKFSSSIFQGSQELGNTKQKPCTNTSQNKSTHLTTSDIKEDMPRNQNQKKERKDSRRRQRDSKRPSSPDNNMPKKATDGRERHPEKDNQVQHTQKEHWLQKQDNQDDDGDARKDTDNCKSDRKTMPSETFKERNSAKSNFLGLLVCATQGDSATWQRKCYFAADKERQGGSERRDAIKRYDKGVANKRQNISRHTLPNGLPSFLDTQCAKSRIEHWDQMRTEYRKPSFMQEGEFGSERFRYLPSHYYGPRNIIHRDRGYHNQLGKWDSM